VSSSKIKVIDNSSKSNLEREISEKSNPIEAIKERTPHNNDL